MSLVRNGAARLALVLLLLATTAASCRTAELYNLPPATIPRTDVTQKQVQKAIHTAAARRGWRTRDEGPGKIVAELYARGHYAAVDIAYSAKTYGITYKDSRNLNYDGKQIHSQYFTWVGMLDRQIMREIQNTEQ